MTEENKLTYTDLLTDIENYCLDLIDKGEVDNLTGKINNIIDNKTIYNSDLVTILESNLYIGCEDVNSDLDIFSNIREVVRDYIFSDLYKNEKICEYL